jgi:hypothetical protein
MGNLIYNSLNHKSIKLSTTGTEAIYRGIVVMGSAIAKTDWQRDLVIWFSEMNQNIKGIGLVGFDILKIGWNAEDFEEQKKFVLDVLNYVKKHKSWNNYNNLILDEYGTDNVGKLIDLFSEVKKEDIQFIYTPEIIKSSEPNKYTYCAKHNVLLNSYPEESGQKCMVCGTITLDESIEFKSEENLLPEDFEYGWIISTNLNKPLNTKREVLDALDKFCTEKNLRSLGNLWTEMNIGDALNFMKNGISYELAYNSQISTDEFIDKIYNKIQSLISEDQVVCCLMNTSENPWENNSYASWDLTNKWTINIACVIATNEKIIFSLFVAED